ncbi:hypothetical protein C8N24_0276 [Solirubrobacter pauli]|uniref:Protein involved in plasmid replication-relaxation n=1 Tax=Solirubrobacter pauli TaxID=166793 RepID=A0A660L605_9ACTN|nr:hypothetical protein C8N24_0276 [Solirubrobacter pauli]
MLEWVARFRFVTAAATAEQFGVDVVNARRRLKRMEQAKLLGVMRSGGTAPIFYVASAGRQLLGLPWRAAPRGDLQRAHELAIVDQVTRFERHAAEGVRVLTERECRRAEADGAGQFHVTVRGEGPRGLAERWPDIVLVDSQDRRVAVELEFSPKHTARLQRIVEGFLDSREYAQVLYLVDSVPLARRLTRLIDDGTARRSANATNRMFDIRATDVRVLAWHDADQAVTEAIDAERARSRPRERAA